MDMEALLKYLKVESDDALKTAIGHVRLAREFDRADKFELAISHARKALRSAEVFHQQHENCQIVLAPFTYVQGKYLATYVECNVDEMNNLKPLELPDDSEDDAPAEDPAATAVESKNGASAEKGEKDDDEPEIKSVDDGQIEEKPATNAVALPVDESNEFEEIAQDIFENFALTS